MGPPARLQMREWRRRGFTFLELIIVLAILGLIFGLASTKLTNIFPKYKLRAAARQIGRKIEELRITAISRGVTMGIHYVLDGTESYYQIIPGPPLDYPEQPPEDRELLGKEKLEDGVRIVRVHIRAKDQVQAISSGAVDILFSPSGTTGSHAITLATEDERYMTIDMNAITGTVDYFESEYSGRPEDFEG